MEQKYFIKPRNIFSLIALIIVTILLLLLTPVLIFFGTLGFALSASSGIASFVIFIIDVMSLVLFYAFFWRMYSKGFKTIKQFMVYSLIVFFIVIYQAFIRGAIT